MAAGGPRLRRPVGIGACATCCPSPSPRSSRENPIPDVARSAAIEAQVDDPCLGLAECVEILFEIGSRTFIGEIVQPDVGDIAGRIPALVSRPGWRSQRVVML